jgi:hypothetical protein
MSEHYVALLWIAAGGLVLVALWVLSYRFVRWDTHRRGLRSLERRAWVVAAAALPLLGFAFYLFVQVMQRYLTPLANPVPETAHPPAQRADGAVASRTPAIVRAPYRSVRARYALVVIEGPHVGQQFMINGFPAQIGRGSEAVVALEHDLTVSRRHAELYEWNGALHLRDLGSSHGTYINGSRVVDQPLSLGDHLVIGKSTLIICELP